MEDLCFLDSAVCNSSLRTGFLETLKVCHCSDVMKESDKSFDWVLLRGLRVKKFCLGWSGLKLTPRVETILRSRHLLLLEGVDLGNVELLVKRFSVDIIVLRVNWQETFDALLLKKYGQRLMRVSLTSYSKVDDYNIIAACCPNLKEFSAPNKSFILPIVDACELDVINNCHLGSLVKRRECEWTYWCDLVRTTVVDETAVCLGEGKYYHMTNLQCRRDMTDEDVKLLSPLMTHLTQLRLFGNVLAIASAAVGRCYKLTKIDVIYFLDCFNEVRLLLQQSSKLRYLILTLNRLTSVDACFDVVAYSCPLLESCVMNDCAVNSADVMSALFSGCSCLTEFTASRWPYAAGAEGLEYLSVGFVLNSQRYGRGLKRLSIEREVSEDVLMEIPKNPNLRSIEVSLRHVSCELIETLVISCPHLTSVAIYNSIYAFNFMDLAASAIAPLGQCWHLDTLLLECISTSPHTLKALLENKQSLRSLTLDDCNISSDMVAIIGDYCPALTYLDLTSNGGIQRSDIIALLQRCCKLEQLKLNSCADIDPEILSSIKSPPLRFLFLNGIRITSKDIKDFGVAFPSVR